MNKTIRMLAMALSVSAAMLSFADDEEAAEDAEEVEVPKAQVPTEKVFHQLPFCRLLEGRGEVRKPLKDEWRPIEEGKFYPLGCSYRCVGERSRLTIGFGKECQVEMVGDASFGTRPEPLGNMSNRVAILSSGTITVKLPRNMPTNFQFSVVSPGFAAVNLAGESKYTFTGNGDGDEALIRCVTGYMEVKGRHYHITDMRAADEVKIRTSQDMLFTGIYGTSGDYHVRLDQGKVQQRDYETGESRIEDRTLDWKMSPQTAVRIHRAVPKIGELLAVTVMTFDANGELRNRCAFTEGRYEINTGEQGPKSAEKKEELAKKAEAAAKEADDAAKGSAGEGE